MDILVTNNPLVKAKYQGEARIDFVDTDLLGVLVYVRNLIHKGHRLVTHPLSGSVKPNETFYKSVLITDLPCEPDVQSVTIIEESVLATEKFPKREFHEKYLYDMQVVDFSLIDI